MRANKEIKQLQKGYKKVQKKKNREKIMRELENRSFRASIEGKQWEKQ